MKKRILTAIVLVLGIFIMAACNKAVSIHYPDAADLEQVKYVSGLLSEGVNVWQKIDIKFNIQKKPGDTVLIYALSHDLTFNPVREPSITLFGQNKPEFAIAFKVIQDILKKQEVEVIKGADIKGKYFREATLLLKLDAMQPKAKWNDIWIRIFNEYPRFFYNIQAEPVLTIITFEGVIGNNL